MAEKLMKGIRVYLWTSFAVGAVLSVIAQVHSEDESSIPVTVQVTRRFFQDLYTTLQPNSTQGITMQCDDNATYLVNESQCINNNHLFNGNLKCMILDSYFNLNHAISTQSVHL